jgi:hypothetical protein
MTRVVSVLEVANTSLWKQLADDFDLGLHLGEALSPLRRVALPSFEKDVLAKLGPRVLVRYARRPEAAAVEAQDTLAARIETLPKRTRDVLHAAQRHALDGVVLGLHAWDPDVDAPHVRALHGAGLIEVAAGDPLYRGRYRTHPDLPPAPSVPYDFSEATMEETDDLSAPLPGPAAILQDAASLAAGLDHVVPRRTHKGTVGRTDSRRLGKRIGAADLAEGVDLETHPRWGMALRALEALGAVSMDPLDRKLQLDLGLDRTLSGETHDAIDRFIHRILERDVHPVLPAVRAALRAAGGGAAGGAAGNGAVDELIFMELLQEQHRHVLFPSWEHKGHRVYPMIDGERPRRCDAAGWDGVEARAIDRALRRMQRVGLIRRAPGVFAPTEDGRHWAEAHDGPRPPIWVSSDLEIIVPPAALTPWERFQLERLGRCLSRDVTDRLRLEREGLVRWLAWHDLDEALAVLRKRAPGLPPNVEDTLRAWDQAARQIVLTRGVLIEDD